MDVNIVAPPRHGRRRAAHGQNPVAGSGETKGRGALGPAPATGRQWRSRSWRWLVRRGRRRGGGGGSTRGPDRGGSGGGGPTPTPSARRPAATAGGRRRRRGGRPRRRVVGSPVARPRGGSAGPGRAAVVGGRPRRRGEASRASGRVRHGGEIQEGGVFWTPRSSNHPGPAPVDIQVKCAATARPDTASPRVAARARPGSGRRGSSAAASSGSRTRRGHIDWIGSRGAPRRRTRQRRVEAQAVGMCCCRRRSQLKRAGP